MGRRRSDNESTGVSTSKKVKYKIGTLKLQPVTRRHLTTTFAHFTYTYSALEDYMITTHCLSSDLTEDDILRLLAGVRSQRRHRYRKSIDLKWPPTNVALAWRRAKLAVDLWLLGLAEEEESEETSIPLEPGVKTAPTVAEFWIEYSDWKIRSGDWGAKYQRSATTTYYKWIHPHFGSLRLCSVTPQDLSEWRLLLYNNMTVKTAKNRLMIFKAMFEHAKKLDAQEAFIQSTPYRLRHNVNPFDGMIYAKLKKGAGTERLPIAFSEEELALFMKNAKLIYPTLYPMVVIAIRTGMRIGEIKGLRWSDIEWSVFPKPSVINVKRSVSTDSGGGVVVTEGKTSNAARRIPMTTDLDSVLREWSAKAPSIKRVLSECISHRTNNPHAKKSLKQRGQRGGMVQIATDPDGYIFVNVRTWKKGNLNTGVINTTRLRDKLKALGKLSAYKQRINGWHDFRHSWISHAVAKQLDWKWIQTVAGHGDLKTTMMYIHLIDDSDENINKVFSAPESGPQDSE